MVIDGQHKGPRVSLEMVLQIRGTLDQRKRQHDGFATQDGVEVMNK